MSQLKTSTAFSSKYQIQQQSIEQEPDLALLKYLYAVKKIRCFRSIMKQVSNALIENLGLKSSNARFNEKL